MQEDARGAADQAHERSAEPAELEECGYGWRPAALREFALRLLSCGTYFSWVGVNDAHGVFVVHQVSYQHPLPVV